MALGYWTQEQFAEMSWHDNYVHALRIVQGGHGAGELVLDLDYILEWIKGADGMRFRILPVNLRFIEVTTLRITLDYASPSAAMGPFSIHAIERRTEARERYAARLWKILVSWPVGEITFEASGYEQRGWGKQVLSHLQHLLPEERVRA
jgi:hypothetical protein